MKLFNTTNMDIINNCRQHFDVKLPSTVWSDRVRSFEKKKHGRETTLSPALSQAL